MTTFATDVGVRALPANPHAGRVAGFQVFYISLAQSEKEHLQQMLAAFSRAHWQIEPGSYRGSDVLTPDEIRDLPNSERVLTELQETGESLRLMIYETDGEDTTP